MLSKSQIKLITSLKQKKYRKQHQLFVAEGKKTIQELLGSDFELYQLYTITDDFGVSDHLQTVITSKELEKISFLKTPNTALALFNTKDFKVPDPNQLMVALDNIQDPGNLGTIIRLCDWFGIEKLICNSDTVDCYNPKVVQATMGSLARVDLIYTQLSDYLSKYEGEVFGAFMDGEDIYSQELPQKGIIILGNEGNGISPVVERHIGKRLAIPRFGKLQHTESLNVANATAIFLSEFRRRSIEK